MGKPTIFIGSSKEGLKIAEAVFSHLSHDATPKLWTNQLFLPGSYPLEVLEEQVRENSFAILIASPDDEIIKFGVSSPAMRDNLMLEFGMFMGAVGRKRAFFICPNEPKINLPSNLFGIIIADYDSARISNDISEVSAAVQVPCQQIKAVIKREWEIIKKEQEEIASKIRASEKGKAIELLHSIVTQLRDAVMVVQRDAFAAVSDELAFRRLKESATKKVEEIKDSFSHKAKLIGVDSEVEHLATVTIDAIKDMPFPHELSFGKEETQRKVMDTGLGALSTFLGGGDPFKHVQDTAIGEGNRRVEHLKEKYIEWWDRHYPFIQEATTKLQDSLFQAAIQLASIAK